MKFILNVTIFNNRKVYLGFFSEIYITNLFVLKFGNIGGKVTAQCTRLHIFQCQFLIKVPLPR